MIFSTLFRLVVQKIQTVTIKTQAFEEDVCQISKLWFHKKKTASELLTKYSLG